MVQRLGFGFGHGVGGEGHILFAAMKPAKHEAPFDEDVRCVLHGIRKVLQFSWIERCAWQREVGGGGHVVRSRRWGRRRTRGVEA
jgi:hypothetical protein